MRISPKSLSPSEVLGETDSLDATADLTSPGAIDASRAQRLLERAASLASRGDMSAAVLATRQSLALAPDQVEGHLLHAKLLERSRDFGGARAAYEKSVQLAPDHADARANLTRLDAYLTQSQGAAGQFHFDADELFAPGPKESEFDDAPIASAPAVAEVGAQPIASTDPTEMLDQSMLPSLEARLPPSREELLASTHAGEASEIRSATTPELTAQQNAGNAPVESVSAVAAAPIPDRRKHNTPVATERRRVASSVKVPLAVPVAAIGGAAVVGAASVAAPARAGTAAPLKPANPFDNIALKSTAAPARAPLALDLPPVPAAPLWQQMVSRPSFYARTLPLVGVALLSLGFLSWARGRAVSNVVTPASTELASAEMTTMPDAPATVPGTTLPLPNNANQPGASPATDAAGFPISNAPAVFQAPPVTGAATTANGAPSNGAPARTNGGAASTPARANNRGPNSSSNNRRSNRILPPARPVPNFPGVSLAPAPIPQSSLRDTAPSAGQNNGGSNLILPSPSIEMPIAPVPRQRVLPPTDNGLNPAGSPNRGYVRVTEGRVGNGVIPSQPSAVARDNERQADNAARGGQGDEAISQLSQAIRADSDNAGFRYQQRATLFLQRGDYSRATDDFQSAISAYQSQISRGDDVAQARRGLSSARSGLNLALAGKR